MKYLREFVNHVESQCDIYPCNPYGVTPRPVLCSNISHPLKKNFISQMIASTVHSEILFSPMLQIVECAKEFVIRKNQDGQKYKFCKLTLVDGDNHIMHCRLSIHLSSEYDHLKKEMIMRLDRYTPLRYRVNDFSQLLQRFLYLSSMLLDTTICMNKLTNFLCL